MKPIFGALLTFLILSSVFTAKFDNSWLNIFMDKTDVKVKHGKEEVFRVVRHKCMAIYFVKVI